MFLSAFDLVVVFATTLVSSTIGYVLGYLSFLGYAKFQKHLQVKRNEALLAYLKKNPQYPFNLPIVETWTAGEFICDECGKNNYFSMLKLEPHHLPPGEMREAAAAQNTVHKDVDGMRHTKAVGFYKAPLLLQCQHCKGLSANGEAMTRQEKGA